MPWPPTIARAPSVGPRERSSAWCSPRRRSVFVRWTGGRRSEFAALPKRAATRSLLSRRRIVHPNMASDHHRTGVVHMSHAYVATCACGWLGEDHPTAGPAIREAADHETASRSEPTERGPFPSRSDRRPEASPGALHSQSRPSRLPSAAKAGVRGACDRSPQRLPPWGRKPLGVTGMVSVRAADTEPVKRIGG